MDNTVEKLDALFQKADTDINNLSDRLKAEFEDNGVEGLLESNPSELVKKIAGVKKEFASIMQQAEAVKQAEQEAMIEFRRHINDVCQLLLKLQNTDSLPSEKPEELTRLEQFLGTKIPWGQGSTSISKKSDRSEDKTDSACGDSTIVKSLKTTHHSADCSDTHSADCSDTLQCSTDEKVSET